MSFILKIVEGPNKGAEVALVDGIAVTLGKGEDCDIVLADSTMPDEPLTLLASADGVTVGGESIAPLHVKTVGATSFAVGPADAPWGELKWPEGGNDSRGDAKALSEEGVEGNVLNRDAKTRSEEGGEDGKLRDSVPPREKKKRRGCLGCLVVLFLFLLALSALGWFYREKSREVCKVGYAKVVETYNGWGLRWSFKDEDSAVAVEKPTLEAIAAHYGLALEAADGSAKMSGNFKTRRERLAATAEAYAVQPGVELDFSDDESLRSSAEDALFTLTEGALRLSVATNRFLKIVGRSPSAAALTKTLKSLDSDMPKLNGVDVTGVAFGHVPSSHGAAEPVAGGSYQHAKSRKNAATPSLPVCGILTTPYPCLITRDGRRYHEGAALGDSVIVKIGADSVVLTNSTGRFTWKP